jgi:beta-alanine degradation protein BauB
MPFKCNEPAVPTIQQEDSTVRITRWDAVMKIEAPDGAVSEIRRKAGESYQRPAGVEHDVMNASEHPIAFVDIEIKRPEALVQAK